MTDAGKKSNDDSNEKIFNFGFQVGAGPKICGFQIGADERPQLQVKSQETRGARVMTATGELKRDDVVHPRTEHLPAECGKMILPLVYHIIGFMRFAELHQPHYVSPLTIYKVFYETLNAAMRSKWVPYMTNAAAQWGEVTPETSTEEREAALPDFENDVRALVRSINQDSIQIKSNFIAALRTMKKPFSLEESEWLELYSDLVSVWPNWLPGKVATFDEADVLNVFLNTHPAPFQLEFKKAGGTKKINQGKMTLKKMCSLFENYAAHEKAVMAIKNKQQQSSKKQKTNDNAKAGQNTTANAEQGNQGGGGRGRGFFRGGRGDFGRGRGRGRGRGNGGRGGGNANAGRGNNSNATQTYCGKCGSTGHETNACFWNAKNKGRPVQWGGTGSCTYNGLPISSTNPANRPPPRQQTQANATVTTTPATPEKVETFATHVPMNEIIHQGFATLMELNDSDDYEIVEKILLQSEDDLSEGEIPIDKDTSKNFCPIRTFEVIEDDARSDIQIKSIETTNIDIYDENRHYVNKEFRKIAVTIKEAENPLRKYMEASLHLMNATKIPQLFSDGMSMSSIDEKLKYFSWLQVMQDNVPLTTDKTLGEQLSVLFRRLEVLCHFGQLSTPSCELCSTRRHTNVCDPEQYFLQRLAIMPVSKENLNLLEKFIGHRCVYWKKWKDQDQEKFPGIYPHHPDAYAEWAIDPDGARKRGQYPGTYRFQFYPNKTE